MTTVEDIMTTQIYTVSPNEHVARIRNLFLKKGISRVVVYEGAPLGIITQNDLADAFIQARNPIDEIPAKNIMTKKLNTLPTTATVDQAAKLMHKKNISSLPVIENDEVVGLITKTDLAKYFQKTFKEKLTVKEVMSLPTKVTKNHTLFHATKLLAEKKADQLIVMQDNMATGTISSRDVSFASGNIMKAKYPIISKISRGKGLSHKKTSTLPLLVGDLMQTNLVKTTPCEDASKAVEKILKNKAPCAIVEDKGEIVGVLSRRSIINYLASL